LLVKARVHGFAEDYSCMKSVIAEAQQLNWENGKAAARPQAPLDMHADEWL
jgi:hypothetical protein